MTSAEIQPLLTGNYGAFLSRIRSMPDLQAHMAAPGKWSPAQQAEHLVKSVRPVAMAFAAPKFMLTLIFGKSNRPSRSYDELVTKYKTKLEAGGIAPSSFVPGVPRSPRKVYGRLERVVTKLSSRINRFSEAELDIMILPHPLLGKLTLREMLYFTAYHADHHRRSIEFSHPSD